MVNRIENGDGPTSGQKSGEKLTRGRNSCYSDGKVSGVIVAREWKGID